MHPEDLEACHRYIENVFVTARPFALLVGEVCVSPVLAWRSFHYT